MQHFVEMDCIGCAIYQVTSKFDELNKKFFFEKIVA